MTARDLVKKREEEVPQADELIKLAGMSNCPRPIVFGVTNFDLEERLRKLRSS